ncbi:MAG: MBL fold metallo-hydrolase [Planctomycetota bacterium]|jgi:L-ascorbate metabolism protein UlaG (beta-lactamase superfamily)
MNTRRIGTIGSLLLATSAAAEPALPVAVRFWGQSLVTIETAWNLRIAVDPYALRTGYDDPGIEADLVLVTHEHFDHGNVDLIRGEPHVVRGLDDDGAVRSIDLVLDRPPNRPAPEVFSAAAAVMRSEHAVRVRSIASHHDESSGSKRGNNAMFLIEADGVRILHCGDFGEPAVTARQLGAIGSVDVLLIPVGGVFTVDGRQAARITETLQPRIVVPIHYRTEALKIELETAEPFLAALGERYERVRPVGNTLAVTRGRGPTRAQPRVVVLGTRSWPMPPEMAALFSAKEKACRAAQAVFAPLTAAQMDHHPADGTHTPRWNAEHMMGRELGFFSAVYSALDPAIGAIDLNPAQMPANYGPAHPDWTGAEEARQLERVARFTRRFAYLLEGMKFNDKPQGSPWTLRELLEQMNRHYTEHTANVIKKSELPDWPAASPAPPRPPA